MPWQVEQRYSAIQDRVGTVQETATHDDASILVGAGVTDTPMPMVSSETRRQLRTVVGTIAFT